MTNYRAIILLVCLMPLGCSGILTDELGSEASFLSAIQKAGMRLAIPDGYTETAVVDNRDVRYNYALKHGVSGDELRYALRPHNNNEMLSQTRFAQAFYETALMNITHSGKTGTYTSFELLKPGTDFYNADWGLISVIELDSDKASQFARGYTGVAVICLGKDDYGQVYLFYMTNNLENVLELISVLDDELAGTLKFSEK